MKTLNFTKLARKNIQSLVAYVAKETPCRVKLDANESPYCPLALDDILSKKDIFSSLNRYPDPESKELKKAIAGNLKVRPENILIGNGSDEIITYLISAFGGPVLYPVPTFVMYGITSQTFGQRHTAIPLDKDFDLDLDKMLKSIRKEKPKLIFLSSPNNPTGNCYSADKILKIIEASGTIVVVDEAYQPFSSKKGFLPLLKDYRNLAILRTLSKIGFAGIRTGYLIADRELIEIVDKTRLPYNLNSLSQALAIAGIKNKNITDAQIKTIIKERKRLFNELTKLQGVQPYPSEANFILFKVHDADAVFKGLVEIGVLVRNMNGVVKNALRVTIGTPDENEIFIASIKKVLASIIKGAEEKNEDYSV
jgi:histidinol-phosphate aminotransferase